MKKNIILLLTGAVFAAIPLIVYADGRVKSAAHSAGKIVAESAEKVAREDIAQARFEALGNPSEHIRGGEILVIGVVDGNYFICKEWQGWPVQTVNKSVPQLIHCDGHRLAAGESYSVYPAAMNPQQRFTQVKGRG